MGKRDVTRFDCGTCLCYSCQNVHRRETRTVGLERRYWVRWSTQSSCWFFVSLYLWKPFNDWSSGRWVYFTRWKIINIKKLFWNECVTRFWSVLSVPAVGLAVNGTHDDVIKWNHFPRYWPFVRGIHRSPVNSPHKGQWRGALMFSLICVWINGWVNNREVGDLRRHRGHYDVIVM